jgi:hypothetical protein
VSIGHKLLRLYLIIQDQQLNQHSGYFGQYRKRGNKYD